MTIYALSSGPGISGVAVIRISGKEAFQTISHFLSFLVYQQLHKGLLKGGHYYMDINSYTQSNMPLYKELSCLYQNPHPTWKRRYFDYLFLEHEYNPSSMGPKDYPQ